MHLSKDMFLNGSKEISVISNSFEETGKLGEEFAHIVDINDTVLCIGDLGSGKTSFIQAFCASLKVKSYINSPTFKLINEYDGVCFKDNKKIKIYHFDFYRLNDYIDIENLGWYEYLSNPGIVIVEWADRAMEVWPESRWEIKLTYLGKNKREIKFKKKG